MRFTIITGLKKTPKTELTNIGKDGKTKLSDWSEISISAPNKPKTPVFVGHDAYGEITNHLVMAKTKASVRYPFKFVKKITTKNI